MLNLVIITPGFAVDEQDDISVPFLQLYIKELIKQKIRLTIITEQYPAKENYKWNGIEVITITKKEPALLTKLLRKLRFTRELNKIRQTGKIDAVHNLWFNETALWIDNFTQKNNIRHITTFTGQDALPINKTLQKLDQYNGKLVAVSQFQKNILQKNNSIICEVIEWGIEQITNDPDSRPIDLIYCGWINEIKNYPQFIEIVLALNKKGLLKKVVICGGGDQLALLQKDIAQNNLQNVIETKGSVPRVKVLTLMKQSKILVHTSHYESFGLVLAEGLSFGCSIISKPVGIAYDNPDIIACNTTEEFIKSITQQLQTPVKKNSPQKHYPISRTVQYYISLFRN